MNHSVVFHNVTKKYKMYKDSSDRLKGVFAPNRYGEDFYAVKHISFTADPGDVIGVVGVNGAGKSTLSNLISGVAPPTTGEITVNGQVSIIAIASGLDKELTGRDNIEYKCLMLGFTKKEIEALMPQVIEFADIGNFIDQPVKNYSSGMKSRLGFAISVNIDPDVLVIDEALSVGDQTFKQKCYDKMNEFKEKGKTIFFVSHSLQQVRKFCNKVLWLEAGEVRAYGKRIEVLPQYRKFLKQFKALSDEEKRNFRQRVMEKRSKLEQEENKDEKDAIRDPVLLLPRNKASRADNYKRKFSFLSSNVFITLLLLLFVAVGTAIYLAKPWEGFFQEEAAQSEAVIEEEPEPEPVQKETAAPEAEEEREENEQEIQYVTVSSAHIRTEPDLDSEASAFTNFGEIYQIENKEEDEGEAIHWLKIAGVHADKEGWISSDLLEEISGESDDAAIAGQMQATIGSHPVLEEISEGNEPEEVFSGSDEDKQEISIPVHHTVLKEDVTEQLGEPHLEDKNNLLYHGSVYDFLFSLRNDQVEDLVIVKR
ncbi:teichoic acids export ABC transporter ATP-binding subunit TagH [Virgibacillus alimentarius]|uniref:teichoic acids export ABC transporter ATP-binding subunit TagH n=1 Tax=Virgibacillus alimentarius TaxID=698769 RepID=UPI000492F3EC|nr:teichoic acids export ABC transporter ATP-binding subunit TagH [Virgibacillus alimentarius]